MKFDERLVKREYFKNLFPMIFSTLGGTLNTFVDSIFVSNFVGEKGLAAVSLCLPIYLCMCTMGALVGSGAGVVSLGDLAHDNVNEAEKEYNIAIKLCIIFGAIITVIGCVFNRPISALLSQGTDIYEEVYVYALYSFLSAVPNCLLYVAIQYLQMESKLRDISYFMAIMIGADILLDYLLMAVFEMGMRGAALASLISVILAVAYGFLRLEKSSGNYHFKKVSLARGNVRKIFLLGSPFATGNCYDVIKTIVINGIILNIGGTGAMAVLAIINSIAEISMSITTGVPSAAGPLEGVFALSRENGRLKSVMKLQLKTGLILTTAASALYILLHRVIAVMFATDTNLLGPLSCFCVFLMLDVSASIYSNYMNVCNHAVLANLYVFYRRLLCPILAVVCVVSFGLYIWSFYILMGILTAVMILITVYLFLNSREGKSHSLEGLLLLNYSLDRNNKVIDFSVDATNEKICEASEQIADFCASNNMSAKTGMKLQMAIEELLTVYVARNDKLDSIDLRAYALPGNLGIRVRVGGVKYNPFEADDAEDEGFLLGIKMIEKMAQTTTYTYTLGLNNINIIFDTDDVTGESNVTSEQIP